MNAAIMDTNSPFGTYRAMGLVRAAWRLADRHDLSAGLRKRIRGLVSHLFAGPYDTEVEGLKFRIYPGQNYDDRKMLAKGRLPEKAEHKLLSPYFTPGCTFVDVGANVGSYSLFAARNGASVLAVEANPETAAKLAFNIKANGQTGVRIAETAIGSSEGTLELWTEPSNCGFATLLPELTEGEWAGDWSSRPVSVVPLTTLVEQQGIGQIDMLKVDVEGFEDRVIMPYLRTADRSAWPRVVMLETNCREHWLEDCQVEMENLGYRIAGNTDDNTIFELAA